MQKTYIALIRTLKEEVWRLVGGNILHIISWKSIRTAELYESKTARFAGTNHMFD